tara:strand:+ start:8451 stop:9980 length:1530 start_codon:yes stop_codon:yes gene_type:complete
LNFTIKTKTFIIGVLISFNLFAQSNREVKEQPLEVVLGIDRIIQLDFAPSTKIQVGNNSILTYQIIPQKREITFKGLKPGKTSVIIRNTVGDIRARYLLTITSSDLSSKVMELKEYLGDIEGIEIGIKGKNVYVGGKIVVPSDMGMINIVLKGYPDVLNFVELSHQSQLKVAEKMEVELNRMGLKKVRVRVVNNTFWLVGRVDSEKDIPYAQKIATAFIPGSIATIAERERVVQTVQGGKALLRNFLKVVPSKAKKSLPIKKMIKISAQFVEVVKEYMKIFGFKWSPLMSGGGGVIKYGRSKAGDIYTDSNGTLAGTISNLFPKLASAKAAGYARVVQSGMIIVKDGQKGTISKETTTSSSVAAKGQFSTKQTTTAKFNLEVKPQLQSKSKEIISLQVSVGVSQGDGSASTTSNKLNSEVDVRSGETAVMGGVAIKKTSTQFDRDPPYGEIDYSQAGGGQPAVPLFSFLKSKKYLNDRNQFVVFATPSIIETASENVEVIKSKFLKRGR